LVSFLVYKQLLSFRPGWIVLEVQIDYNRTSWVIKTSDRIPPLVSVTLPQSLLHPSNGWKEYCLLLQRASLYVTKNNHSYRLKHLVEA
jgi:hypothetical protein